MFVTPIDIFLNLFGNRSLILLSLILGSVFASVLFFIINNQASDSKIVKEGRLSLSVTLIFFILANLTLIIRLLHFSGTISLSLSFVRFMGRTNWFGNIMLHLSLSLFMESMVINDTHFSRNYNRLRVSVCTILALLFFITLLPSLDILLKWGSILRRIAFPLILAVNLQTIYRILQIIKKKHLPRILQYQIQTFICTTIIPILILKIFTYNMFADKLLNTKYLFTTISITIHTIAMFYCTFKLMGLRFLNTRDHITESRKFNFVALMKEIMSDMHAVSNSAEFRHYTQQVFSKAFSLPDRSVQLILMQDANYTITEQQLGLLRTTLAPNTELAQLLYRTKVITRDEIEFSAYYDQNPAYLHAADFLKKFNADIFVPVYDRSTLLGCIIVNENTRPKKFYSGKEQDEMALFAASLSSIITVVRNRNIDVLLAQKQSVETELYQRFREISQYQESIRSFVRQSHENAVGILYYKHGSFTFGNQTAHELVSCDPNSQRGHPLTIHLRKIAQNTEKYAMSQHTTICIDGEQRLTVSSFPSLEKQCTVLIVTHPSIADIIRLQSDLLNEPGQWNYLLYLETTETGHRVREIIPGTNKTLLNFKIDLLRAALSHRPVLLNMRAEDRLPFVNLLHTASQREQISIINLREPEKELSVAKELFGFAQVLGLEQTETPLLEKLDKIGTIYLENVHLLSRETQSHLAEFLRFGAYTRIRGEQRTAADVRIICSSSESLVDLVEQDLFLPELLDELRMHSIVLPQPNRLSHAEFGELVQEYMHQLLKNHALKKILVLSEREIDLLYKEKCTTYYELKRRLTSLISAKTLEHEVTSRLASSSTVEKIKTSKKIAENEDVTVLPAYADERIQTAIMLGKHALQDRELMEYLWCTFQNQSQIATLLGVNRSSVHRRFKQLNIGSK